MKHQQNQTILHTIITARKMPIDKILGKIRTNIHDLNPLLEGFFEQEVQPGVEECTQIQRHLNELLEYVAVYKYTKLNYEVSPSFNLHARISETAETLKKEIIPPPDARAAGQTKKTEQAPEKTKDDARGPVATRPLQIGLNDKFRFINELFAHNDPEYHIAVEQLSNLGTWAETDLYLNSLKNLYGWRDNHDAVKYFYSLVKKRFQ